ncbi:MAG: C40 family peptidase [Acidimicrobiia bacterium]
MELRRRLVFSLVIAVAALAGAACVPKVPTPAPGPPGAPSAGAAAAVAYAKAQVGVAYCHAGTGPTCFDCSGLTQQAWKAGGLTIPRTSGAQFAAYPQVPLDQLQPGDLLFPADPAQHVGIYIGPGMMVHATKPGSTVKEVAIATYGVTQAVRPG